MSALTLTGNIALNSRMTVNRDLTLDLAGHKLTAGMTGYPMFSVSGATLTLTGDGEVSNPYFVGFVNNGGTIHVENGTYTSSNQSVFRAQNGGTVIFDDGIATGREGAITCRGADNAVTVNGGHLTGLDNFAVATNGSSGMGGNRITINGGVLEGNITSPGYEAIGIYVANDDIFVMNDGEVIAHGGTGLCMRGGDVTINGGSITATGTDKNGNPVADGKIADEGTVMTGVSAIVYHKMTGYSGATKPMKLTVNGGTITGVDYSIQVISDEEHPDITVTGGTLTPAYAA